MSSKIINTSNPRYRSASTPPSGQKWGRNISNFSCEPAGKPCNEEQDPRKRKKRKAAKKSRRRNRGK